MKAIIKRTGEVIEVNPVCPEQWAEIKSDTIGRRVFQRDALILDEPTDWATFRREAAKDILVALCNTMPINMKADVRQAINIADELIKQLKDEK